MSRLADAILTGAYAANSKQPMLDLGHGGQQGWAPNLIEWTSNQAYVRRNLICIMLEAPRMFKNLPDSQKWVQALKSLMELHVRTIEGFNAGLTVETDEHPVGGAGEMQQEVTNVTRARTEPSFTFVEKYGRPIQTLLDYWIRYGLMDPDTKFALASTLGTPPTDMLADWYSMTCLFIEPDPLHRNVVQSWVTTNMFPKGNGEIVGKRDLTTANELVNLTIEMTGLSQTGIGVNVFAQSILDTINLKNSDPYLRPAFVQRLDADVSAANLGYKQEAELVGSEAVSKNFR